MKSQQNELNRRQFLSTVTAAAGILALGTPSAFAFPFFGKSDKRVGISHEAYHRAWERAEALVKQMTLTERISQLGHQASAIERLKIPHYNYYSGEALHGLTQKTPATSFPVPLAMAAAWNPDLVLQAYTVVSDEARAYDNRSENWCQLLLSAHAQPASRPALGPLR